MSFKSFDQAFIDALNLKLRKPYDLYILAHGILIENDNLTMDKLSDANELNINSYANLIFLMYLHSTKVYTDFLNMSYFPQFSNLESLRFILLYITYYISLPFNTFCISIIFKPCSTFTYRSYAFECCRV